MTVCAPAGRWQNARNRLDPRIRGVEMEANDAWACDHGPGFVLDGKGTRRGMRWGFNAWGALDDDLYFPWDQDALVAWKILEIEGAKRYRAPLILEGDSIHVDGEGTPLTTEECLLNPNRNPRLSRSEIETLLMAIQARARLSG